MERQSLEASIASKPAVSSAVFLVHALPGAPSQLRARFRATGQIALPGWAVITPAIGLVDKYGNPTAVSGVAVSFDVTAGGGKVTKSNVLTDANGFASAGSWTIGPDIGLNSVRASVADLGEITFDAQALDARALTWYSLDTVTHRTSPISSGSIGFSKDGYFVAETFYGDLGRAWLGGKYVAAGSGIYLEQYSGTDSGPRSWEWARLEDNRLMIFWCPFFFDCASMAPEPDELRIYVKRK